MWHAAAWLSEGQLDAEEADQRVRHPRIGIRPEDILDVGLDVEPGGHMGEIRELDRRLGPGDRLSRRGLHLDELAAVASHRQSDPDLVVRASRNQTGDVDASAGIPAEAVDPGIADADLAEDPDLAPFSPL